MWRNIKRVSAPYTTVFYLNSLDRRFAPDGSVTMQPDTNQIYITLFLRTLWLSTVVTLSCIFLGYPVAFLLANLPLQILEPTDDHGVAAILDVPARAGRRHGLRCFRRRV